ncbi:MAG: hypothetical protein U9N79_10540 [Actinomycetota bacterium]|nr:hypothetical protein [Actinomycetota bacterium]
MDDSTSHDAQSDAFQIARRGYDRRQVDAYREANDARIDALEQHIQSLEDNMSELGLARPADLAAELDVVGEEVKKVLQEARVAAEQMRSRAADDAARWRAEADEESRALRESTRVAAYETRGSVWEVGSEMLAGAVAASESAATAATERALFIQAEAEREASRLVGDARRERDEVVGGAQDEAERLITAARREAESVTSTARRQADAAQERARALELRRAELMDELETARDSIAGKETEPTPDEAPEEASAAPVEVTAVVEDAGDVRSHWPDDEGSVKIVSAGRVITTEPVDADAMVAEVQAMRQGSEQPTDDSQQPEPEPEPSSVPPAEGPSSSSPSGGGVAEGDGGGQDGDEQPDTSSEPDSEPEVESSSVPTAEGRGDAEERIDQAGGKESRQPEPETEPERESGDAPSSSSPSRGGADEGDGGGQEPEPESKPEPGPSSVPTAEGRGDAEERIDQAGGKESRQPTADSRQPEPEPEPEPEPDALAGLFAQLREPTAETTTTEETDAPDSSSSPSGGGVAEDEGGGQESDELPATSSEPEPEQEPETEGDADPEVDPFALRERHLLPVQNRTLRTVKRRLVEAQNQALENLRLIDGWEPDTAIIDGEVAEALAALARESMVAGFAAAAEMMDTTETPQPEDVDPGDPSAEFTAALVEATQSSVTRSRGAGAGHRETASSLSRVFRSWRTDEAERRVRFASRSAYHIGVAAALADLGATDLAVTSSGRPCRECPANKGPWTIADGLPGGTVMPPALLECACTIVPSP